MRDYLKKPQNPGMHMNPIFTRIPESGIIISKYILSGLCESLSMILKSIGAGNGKDEVYILAG